MPSYRTGADKAKRRTELDLERIELPLWHRQRSPKWHGRVWEMLGKTNFELSKKSLFKSTLHKIG